MARSVDRAVYIISVAAELAGVHPQTLRFYERRGLLSPKRTSGNTRRYSERDIERLQMIQDLTQRRGVNLAGAKLIMEMQLELERLRRRARELGGEVHGARGGGAVVPFPWLGRPGCLAAGVGGAGPPARRSKVRRPPARSRWTG